MNTIYALFDEISANWENGNLSDAKEQIRKLSKYNLILFVEYYCAGGSKIHTVISILKLALEE